MRVCYAGDAGAREREPIPAALVSSQVASRRDISAASHNLPRDPSRALSIAAAGGLCAHASWRRRRVRTAPPAPPQAPRRIRALIAEGIRRALACGEDPLTRQVEPPVPPPKPAARGSVSWHVAARRRDFDTWRWSHIFRGPPSPPPLIPHPTHRIIFIPPNEAFSGRTSAVLRLPPLSPRCGDPLPIPYPSPTPATLRLSHPGIQPCKVVRGCHRASQAPTHKLPLSDALRRPLIPRPPSLPERGTRHRRYPASSFFVGRAAPLPHLCGIPVCCIFFCALISLMRRGGLFLHADLLCESSAQFSNFSTPPPRCTETHPVLAPRPTRPPLAPLWLMAVHAELAKV